jgi:hypothetical protein
MQVPLRMVPQICAVALITRCFQDCFLTPLFSFGVVIFEFPSTVMVSLVRCMIIA